MTRAGWICLIILLLPYWARPGHAQNVTLQFHDGIVTLHARDMPLRAILAEWARVGGTSIVNGERVVDARMTLDLDHVPESQAVELLLQGVGGYVAVQRDAGRPGPAIYETILILPMSSPSSASGAVGPPRPVPPEGDVADVSDGAVHDPMADESGLAAGAVAPILRPRDPKRRID